MEKGLSDESEQRKRRNGQVVDALIVKVQRIACENALTWWWW